MGISSGQCFEPRKQSKVRTPPENGKSATFLNPQRKNILLVHADRWCRKGREGCKDCFFEPDQKVADYIVSKPGLIDVIVELKGTNIMAAVDQIAETIPAWNKHQRSTGKIGALIVSSKGGTHPDVQAQFLLKQQKFRRQGITLKHMTDPNPTLDFAAFL